MVKDEIEARLALHRERAARIRSTIEGYRDQIVELQRELAQVEGTIDGIGFTRDLFALVPGETDPQPQRHSVQRPVMKLLRDVGPGNTLSEDVIAEKTALPRASVHEFLIRALRKGDVIADGGLYSLPGEPDAGERREAAE